MAKVLCWIVAILGLWTIIAPFALKFEKGLKIDNVIIGIIVLVLAVIAALKG